MWKIMTIRRSYYEIEEVLVWMKNPWDLSASCKLMEMMGIQSANFHNYSDPEGVSQ
jgi:hypothetical protein